MSARPFQQVEKQLVSAPSRPARAPSLTRLQAAGTAQPSFVSLHLEDMERQGTRGDAAALGALKTAAAHMWTGGEETVRHLPERI